MSTTALAQPQARPVFDRGPRPYMRGRLHSAAAWYFGGASTALTIISFVHSGLSWMTTVTALYSLCLVAMLVVSAVYHRAPWRSARAVDGWRRADHATIAVFIAGTYGPVTLGAFGNQLWVNQGAFAWGGSWILVVSWIAAAAAVALNVIWIDHPRWLDATVYLALGWIAIVAAAGFYQQLGPAICVLMVLGGIVYSLGAVIYARKWPNPSERWFGFHEVFHAATIVAAALHHIAIWMIVLR